MQLKKWSFSQWKDYEQCPLRCKLKYLDGHREPSGPAAERGNQIHKKVEDWLSDPGPIPLPEEFKAFEDDLLRFKEEGYQVEVPFALDRAWTRTEWDLRWMGARIDAMGCTLVDGESCWHIIDWKTGKIRKEDHLKQASLYALTMFLIDTTTDFVKVDFYYVDQGVVLPYGDWNRKDDFEPMHDTWKTRVFPMMQDACFEPKTGPLCGWCHFRKSNGGPCPKDR